MAGHAPFDLVTSILRMTTGIRRVFDAFEQFHKILLNTGYNRGAFSLQIQKRNKNYENYYIYLWWIHQPL